MISGRNFLLAAVCGLLLSCGPQQDRSPGIGQAFVGPTTLTLRQDLSTKAPVSATVHHGEPLEILEYKRRFLKVRTAGGIVGWTDIRQLLTPEQMSDLRRLTEGSAKLPSQGLASTFEVLNVHTEPNRVSPSFLQIPEGSKVEVIGHKVTPRVQAAPPPPAPPPKPRPQKRKSKEKQSAKLAPPPMPAAPRPPLNWRSLSRRASEAPRPVKDQAPPAPIAMDDWELIRTRDKRVGWVLSRMITMAIPDDVAQYAEGHRITSYFPIGEVQDEDSKKHNWLWTTIGKGPQPYEFDSFRFFIWSRRHHRYETAYIQRDVVGHYPVEVNDNSPTPAFSLVLETESGHLVKKTYAFNGARVNLISTEPYRLPEAVSSSPPSKLSTLTPTAAPKPQSWAAQLKAKISSLLHR